MNPNWLAGSKKRSFSWIPMVGWVKEKIVFMDSYWSAGSIKRNCFCHQARGTWSSCGWTATTWRTWTTGPLTSASLSNYWIWHITGSNLYIIWEEAFYLYAAIVKFRCCLIACGRTGRIRNFPWIRETWELTGTQLISIFISIGILITEVADSSVRTYCKIAGCGPCCAASDILDPANAAEPFRSGLAAFKQLFDLIL